MNINEKEMLELGKAIIEGTREAKTAEECMISRYVAYTLADIDYIMESHDPETREHISKEETEEWAKSANWLSLEIISTEGGEEKDIDGIVEFKATYEENGQTEIHHEKSAFVKENGKWLYHGWLPIQQTIVKEKKVGRNDPCPCGSGKKYKKCCAK